MAGAKIENARKAAATLVSSLADGDIVALDAFSDNARTVAVDQQCVYWTTTAGQFHVAAPVGIRGAPVALAR